MRCCVPAGMVEETLLRWKCSMLTLSRCRQLFDVFCAVVCEVALGKSIFLCPQKKLSVLLWPLYKLLPAKRFLAFLCVFNKRLESLNKSSISFGFKEYTIFYSFQVISESLSYVLLKTLNIKHLFSCSFSLVFRYN